MDDAEYLFHQQSKTAKRLARGAYAKKGGSRSRKCSLPSDKLTPKQLRERNGKIMSYNLSKPMNWKTFKSLDDETQSEYLYRLAKLHYARGVDVAEMFGINSSYFSQWLKTKSWGRAIFEHTGRKTPHSKWVEFLHPTASDPVYTPEPVKEPENDQTAPPEVKLDNPVASTDKGWVIYTGLPASVFEKAYKLLDNEDEYTVTIMFVKNKKEE